MRLLPCEPHEKITTIKEASLSRWIMLLCCQQIEHRVFRKAVDSTRKPHVKGFLCKPHGAFVHRLCYRVLSLCFLLLLLSLSLLEPAEILHELCVVLLLKRGENRNKLGCGHTELVADSGNG
jgi:hypothetical protein